MLLNWIDLFNKTEHITDCAIFYVNIQNYQNAANKIM